MNKVFKRITFYGMPFLSLDQRDPQSVKRHTAKQHQQQHISLTQRVSDRASETTFIYIIMWQSVGFSHFPPMRLLYHFHFQLPSICLCLRRCSLLPLVSLFLSNEYFYLLYSNHTSHSLSYPHFVPLLSFFSKTDPIVPGVPRYVCIVQYCAPTMLYISLKNNDEIYSLRNGCYFLLLPFSCWHSLKMRHLFQYHGYCLVRWVWQNDIF